MKKFLIVMALLWPIYNALSVTVKDKFVFKLAGEVFTVNELFEYYKIGKGLNCFFKESLMSKVYRSSFSSTNESMFEVQRKFSSEQKEFFNEYIFFAKLLVYTRSYDIELNPNVLKYFKLIAKKNGCKEVLSTDSKSFRPKLIEVLKLEVFLRNRFLPIELQRQASSEDMQKAVASSRNLLNSISDQINQEVYW